MAMTYIQVKNAADFATNQAERTIGDFAEWYQGRADELNVAANEANKLIMAMEGPAGDKVLDSKAVLVRQLENLQKTIR